MKLEERLKLVKEVGEEILTIEELKSLLERKKNPIAYDGFEPSGRIHIAQGILRAINVNKMTKAGCEFKILVADWHGWANNKFGGDLDKIQIAGKYFVEVWKKAGMDLKKVEFIWVSDYFNEDKYLKLLMQIARNTTVKRILRCSQIMGRSESQTLQASQIFYPVMQCADIFHLKADITQLGMDQRKVNVLAREVGPNLGLYKPVVVNHHMLMGLAKPPDNVKDSLERSIAIKMSKSNPDSSIFVEDSKEEVIRKIKKAYCPEKQIKENPVLEYCKFIIFEKFEEFKIEREKKFGGDISFKNYKELEKEFEKGEIHPADLKIATAQKIDELISPIRNHFQENQKAKELLETVKSFKVTK